jgi:hypothetical protein
LTIHKTNNGNHSASGQVCPKMGSSILETRAVNQHVLPKPHTTG